MHLLYTNTCTELFGGENLVEMYGMLRKRVSYRGCVSNESLNWMKRIVRLVGPITQPEILHRERCVLCLFFVGNFSIYASYCFGRGQRLCEATRGQTLNPCQHYISKWEACVFFILGI